MSLIPAKSPSIQKFVRPATHRAVINPSAQPEKDMFTVARSLLPNLTSKNNFNYATNLAKVVLGEQGIKHGVNFDTFTPQEGDARNGFFIQNTNTFVISTKLIGDPQNIGLLTNTIAHELTHCKQADYDTRAKYFGPFQRNIKVGHSTILQKVVNPGGNPYGDMYFMSKMEQDAFAYAGKFAKDFLGLAKQIAEKEGTPAQVAFLEQQIQGVTEEDNAFWRQSAKADRAFIQGKGVKPFCENMQKTFDEFYDLAYANLGFRPITEQDQKTYARLTAVPELDMFKAPSEKIFITLSTVLGRYPKRECVEQYLDLAFKSNIVGVMPMAINRLMEQGVPITHTDFTKAVLSTDFYKADSKIFIAPQTFSRVDESVWVKDMVAAHGVSHTLNVCKNLQKATGLPCPIDFNKVGNLLSSYSQDPIMFVGKDPVYGTAQLLDLAVRELIAKGQATTDQYLKVKSEIAGNLANIVNSFEDISGNNHEYVTALAKFVRNPYEQQFEVEEEISEVGACLNIRVAKAVADEIAVRRREETHDENPVEEDGDEEEFVEGPSGNPFVKKVNPDEFLGEPGPKKKPVKKVDQDSLLEQMKASNLSPEQIAGIMAILNKKDSFISPEDAAFIEEYSAAVEEDAFVPVEDAIASTNSLAKNADGGVIESSEAIMPAVTEKVEVSEGFEIGGQIIPHSELGNVEISTPQQAQAFKPQAPAPIQPGVEMGM